jgi:hypothetical protein
VLNPWLGFIAGWMFLASKIAVAVLLSTGIILTGCVVLAVGVMLRLLFRRGRR